MQNLSFANKQATQSHLSIMHLSVGFLTCRLWWSHDFFSYHHPYVDVQSFWPCSNMRSARAQRASVLDELFLWSVTQPAGPLKELISLARCMAGTQSQWLSREQFNRVQFFGSIRFDSWHLMYCISEKRAAWHIRWIMCSEWWAHVPLWRSFTLSL